MVFNNVNSPIEMDLMFPDVCLTPIIVPVPIPYPNIAMRITAVDFCFNITIWCMPAHNMLTMVPMTLGDNAGVQMGIMSGLMMGPSWNFIASFTVLFEGIPATKMLHPTLQNGFFGNMIGMSIVPGQFNTMTLV